MMIYGRVDADGEDGDVDHDDDDGDALKLQEFSE